jgi:glycosyltransferase involved in cell wall biosynthesis
MMPATPRTEFESSRGAGSLDLSVVVPAYNEANSIRQVIGRLCELASRAARTYEVVVVDDGSADDTYKIVKSMSLVNDSVVALRSPVNSGKGSAVKLAAQFVRGNAVVVIDADMEIDPSSLKEYVAILDRFDICVASKRHPQSSYDAPIMRKFLSVSFNKMVRLTTGIALADSQTGFKAMRGEHFRRILNVISVKRYAYDVEILAVAQLLGLKVAESPVRISQTSQFSKKAIMFMSLDLLGIVYRLRVLRWYQKNLAYPKLKYKPVIPI